MLSDLLTGKDNKTHDLGRWSWASSHLTLILAAAWNALHGVTLDLMQFAQAHGVIAAAHGGALWAKKDTEPMPAVTPEKSSGGPVVKAE